MTDVQLGQFLEVIPGIFVGLCFIVAAYFIYKKRGFRGIRERGSIKEIVQAFKESIWALLAPVIILGGIYAGIATPTEAAVFAVFYSIFVGLFVYHTLDLEGLYQALVDSVVTSSVVMFVVTTQFSIAAVLGVIDTIARTIIHIAKVPLSSYYWLILPSFACSWMQFQLFMFSYPFFAYLDLL